MPAAAFPTTPLPVWAPNKYTWIGLVISFIGINTLNMIFRASFGDQLNNAQMVARELMIFGMVAFLLWFIIPREGLTAASIGLHHRHWSKSLLLSLLIGVVCMAVMLGSVELARALGWPFGQSKSFDKLSPAVITLITIRAGVAEEIFCRGFQLERLTATTGNKWIAFCISTSVFGLAHYPQGYAGIVIATVAGAVFGLFYFKTRDLKGNIIAHFLIDFVANVLLD